MEVLQKAGLDGTSKSSEIFTGIRWLVSG